jgi:transcriptional regulator with XRE-family HTH domain
MDLAERISTLRRVNGLSARQLAALADFAPTTVTRIEAGRVSVSFDLAQEILAVLGESIGFTGVAALRAPHGLSGTASRSKRGVPALRSVHGELSVGTLWASN